MGCWVQPNHITAADRTPQPWNAITDTAIWILQRTMAHLRIATFARVRETTSSIHLPMGVLNAQLSVTTIHGDTLSEDFLECINVCEFCGEEVLPNGNALTVRILDPLTSAMYPHTAEVPDFTPYTCCPTGHTRYTHAQGFYCCPTGLNPSSWVVRNADDGVFAPIVR